MSRWIVLGEFGWQSSFRTYQSHQSLSRFGGELIETLDDFLAAVTK